MNKIKRIGLSFICLLNLLLISSSFAEVKSDSQTSNEILTQTELNQCEDETKSLAQIAKQLNERSSQFEVHKKDISQLENDRRQMSSVLDLHSKVSVDKYNQINKQIKHLTQLYITDTESFNDAVRQYKADIEKHKIECDDKQYYKK